MNNRDRFLNTLNFQKVDDRLPIIEWAGWWDKTINRWREEGVPSNIGYDETREYFGLDMVRQFWLSPQSGNLPQILNEKGYITDIGMYERIKKYIYPEDKIKNIKHRLLELKPLHDKGDVVVWITLEGFFWFPRTLLGIENHLFSFYDEPALLHRINQDLAEYNIFLIEEFCKIIKPDFMTLAEDMSYNLGPMLSYGHFCEFLKPYYDKVIPVLKKHNIIPFVDTDGNLEDMIPWLIEAGIEGVLPLERQSGVDVARIRRNYPHFRMIGGYDKMVMSKNEEQMRKEFKRLLPVMRMGGFIPSCDHQTPPEVSLKNYKIYLSLLDQYCKKAVVEI